MSKSFSKFFGRVITAGFAALSVQMLVPQQASAACSVHDHNCQFHGIGRAVNPNIDPSSPTSVTIITEGSNGLDFDNNVLLPDGFGPYVVSSTGFGTVPGQPFITPAENARHVFPSQFQIDFQANTAQAQHSGDLNGLEIVPGATGCQISTAANCEEITILGNIPDTGNGFIVQQQVHLFNAQNTPNPSIGTESYAVATGRAYIQTPSHLSHAEPSLFQENRNLDSLSGPRDQPNALGDLHTYTIGYNDFDPHAIGEDLFFNRRWQTSTSAYRVAGQHWYQDDLYRDVSTHRNKRFISGLGEESTGDYSKSTRSVFVGTTPSQAYLNHVVEQQRIAAERMAYNAYLADLKKQEDARKIDFREVKLVYSPEYSNMPSPINPMKYEEYAAQYPQYKKVSQTNTAISTPQFLEYDNNPNVKFNRDTYEFYATDDAGIKDRIFVGSMNVAGSIAGKNEEYKISTRAVGGVQAVGGGVGIVATGVVCYGSAGSACALAAPGGIVSADNFVAGSKTLLTGEYADTYVEQGIDYAGTDLLGYDQGSVDNVKNAYAVTATAINLSRIPKTVSSLKSRKTSHYQNAESVGILPAPGTRVKPAGIPENWRITGTKTAGGTNYKDPLNPGNAVRVMQGNPNSPYLNSQMPYVRWQKNGQALDVNGNVVPRNSAAAHIPVDEFNFDNTIFQ